MDIEKLIDVLDELVVIARNAENTGVTKWLQLNDSVADIKELLKEQLKDRWIPVSEKLPSKEEFFKNDGRFIVTDGNRVYQSLFDIYESNTFVYFDNKDNKGTKLHTDNLIIGWKPLPEPYKEKSNES